MKSAIKNVVTLTLITLVAGFLLGLVYEVTKEPIATAQENAKKAAYNKVFEEASAFEEVSVDLAGADAIVLESGINGVSVNEVVSAKDASGNQLGYIITTTSHEGYGGDIEISVGITNEKEVLGVEILEISETAGLGMKANTDEFKGQFKNKSVSKFDYTKSGATQDFEIDAISGATITTKAFVNAVNAALNYFDHVGGND